MSSGFTAGTTLALGIRRPSKPPSGACNLHGDNVAEQKLLQLRDWKPVGPVEQDSDVLTRELSPSGIDEVPIHYTCDLPHVKLQM